VNRSLLAASLVLLGLLSLRPVSAQDVEKACRGMSGAYATVEDATRCAEAHGWKVTRFWVQVSDWSEPAPDGRSYGGRQDLVSSLRILCSAPSYVEENGIRNALWETKSIARRTVDGRASYSYNDDGGTRSFEFLVDAGNAACGPLHLNARPREPAGF
jgi:hypothetical protein